MGVVGVESCGSGDGVPVSILLPTSVREVAIDLAVDGLRTGAARSNAVFASAE